MRAEIEKKLPIKAFDIYGLSEVIGPGVAFECEERNGLHISEDHFLPEVIDPKTGEVLPEGEVGELVFTTLTKEGTPVIRYRTGDISALYYESCRCGRTMVRMQRVSSRTDDMLIIRGINVYPSQIESVILSFDGVEPHYQIVLTRENYLDQIAVHVEVSPQVFSDEVKVLEKLKKQMEEKLKAELNLSCEVKLLEPKSITRSEGKAKRVIDLRKKEGVQ
jgi:phenylacetate-CoA ligase